jgi:hypothetical protein
MSSTPRVAVCVVLLGLATGCHAQAEAAPIPASAAQGRAEPQRPSARTRVIEDRDVRIEETRLRGQVQRITVQNKRPGAPPYEIIVGPGGRDPSQDHGAVGQRTWSLLAF